MDFDLLKALFYEYWKNILIFILLMVLLCSCSTRKVEKSTVKENLTTEQTTTEKKDVEKITETKVVINDESNEIEITPIDTAKVLIINGKTYKNAKVKFINRKSQSTIQAKETFKDQSKSETKINNTSKKTAKTKIIAKKSNPFISLLWLLIPTAIYLVYKYRYKLIGL